MKKFIFIILMAAILCSCDDIVEKMTPGTSESLTPDTKLVELTFEGHSHQFIFNHSYVGNGVYDVEIVHWPSCKYCQEDK